MQEPAEIKKFPDIPAETLSKEKLIFPEKTEGKYAFLVIAFKRQSQGEVDSWLDPFIEDFGEETEVTFYEIPMISGNWKWMSSWIDSGMRAGVPDYKHDHVATYYGPLSKYFDYLNIHDSRKVYTYLLDKQGYIIWNNSGPADSKDYEYLKQLVKSKIE